MFNALYREMGTPKWYPVISEIFTAFKPDSFQ